MKLANERMKKVIDDNSLVCFDCGGIYMKLRVCRECGNIACQTCLDEGNHDIEPNTDITALWAEFSRKYPSLSNYEVADKSIAADWLRTLIRYHEQEKERLEEERLQLIEERSGLEEEISEKLQQANTTSQT